MSTRRVLYLGAIVALCGCSTLQQAPLVYASKTAVGFDISATSTESPGVSMTVGFKQVDAAYVPVAVAKSCESEQKKECDTAAYEMKIVSGRSDNQGTRRSGPSAEEAKKTIQDYEDAAKKVTVAKARVNDIGEQIASLLKRKAELDAKADQYGKVKPSADKTKEDKSVLDEKKAAGTLSEEEGRRLTVLETQITNVEAVAPSAAEQKERNDAEQKIGDARQRLTVATQDVTALEAEAQKLRSQAREAEQQLDRLERTDAFSVYGRFEGNSSAEGTKASVGLGKVFSTGVASQNIASGLGKYYENIGMAACYEAVAKLSETMKEPAELKKLLADCRSSAINNAAGAAAK